VVVVVEVDPPTVLVVTLVVVVEVGHATHFLDVLPGFVPMQPLQQGADVLGDVPFGIHAAAPAVRGHAHPIATRNAA
jgi:hypothetical protein